MKRFGILAAGVLAVAGLLASCSNEPQDVNVVGTVASQNSYKYSAEGSITITDDYYSTTTNTWTIGSQTVYTVSTAEFATGSWSTGVGQNTNYREYSFAVPYSKSTSYSETSEGTFSTTGSVSNSNGTRFVAIIKIGDTYFLTNENYSSLNTPASVTVSPEDSSVSLTWTVSDSNASGSQKKTIKYAVTLTRK